MEQGFRFETDPLLQKQIEQQGQLQLAIEGAIDLVGAGYDPKAVLQRLLASEPQRDEEDGRLRYLLTSGLAVELITKDPREHHDLDLVIMDYSQSDYWNILGTDNVTPGKYWADMQFRRTQLERVARSTILFPDRRRSPIIEMVHPAIILVQKLSDAFGRPPRDKDYQDVKSLVRFYQLEAPDLKDMWPEVIEESILALPHKQQPITRQRLNRTIR